MSTIVETIRQKKLDSLAAKHLHVKALESLNFGIQIVDYLAVCVPVLYFAIRYLAKGTPYDGIAETGWEILAAILLALTLLKIVFRWQDKAQIHSTLLGENIALVGLADELLTKPILSSDNLQFFNLLVQKSEKKTGILLGNHRARTNSLPTVKHSRKLNLEMRMSFVRFVGRLRGSSSPDHVKRAAIRR